MINLNRSSQRGRPRLLNRQVISPLKHDAHRSALLCTVSEACRVNRAEQMAGDSSSQWTTNEAAQPHGLVAGSFKILVVLLQSWNVTWNREWPILLMCRADSFTLCWSWSLLHGSLSNKKIQEQVLTCQQRNLYQSFVKKLKPSQKQQIRGLPAVQKLNQNVRCSSAKAPAQAPGTQSTHKANMVAQQSAKGLCSALLRATTFEKASCHWAG